jgi:cell division protein FtsB
MRERRSLLSNPSTILAHVERGCSNIFLTLVVALVLSYLINCLEVLEYGKRKQWRIEAEKSGERNARVKSVQ